MSQVVAKECFYKLDFDYSIKYCSFSFERKKNIKQIFDKILGLDTIAEKIKFMETTRFMDSTWEDSILNSVQSNLTLQKSYIDAVNKSDGNSITNSTIKCICSFSNFYALKDIVTSRLYTAKKFMHYVICKTLYHKRFILDSSAKIEHLWETYMTIFSGSNHLDIRGYMDRNMDFLKLIMDKKAYTSLSNERRMVLSKIPQDAHSIQESIDRGDSFAVDYYQKIIGFANENAEELFINNLKDKPNLLRSKAIYDHCHSKLKNSVLKAKYTRLRKKGGYV